MTDILEQIQKTIEERDDLSDRVQALESELEEMSRGLGELEELRQENEKLKDRLKNARKTNATLRRIENLEYTVETLTETVRERDDSLKRLQQTRVAEQRRVSEADELLWRMKHIAGRLGIKTEGRTVTSIISALDDKVRSCTS